MASSRCVPASKSAGTTNSTWATPVPSAVTGDSTSGAENSVRLTCSLAWKPEKMTFWVPPATIDGDEMLCTTASLGGAGGVELDDDDDDDGGALNANASVSPEMGTPSGLLAKTAHLPVTQLGLPAVDRRQRQGDVEPAVVPARR